MGIGSLVGRSSGGNVNIGARLAGNIPAQRRGPKRAAGVRASGNSASRSGLRRNLRRRGQSGQMLPAAVATRNAEVQQAVKAVRPKPVRSGGSRRGGPRTSANGVVNSGNRTSRLLKGGSIWGASGVVGLGAGYAISNSRNSGTPTSMYGSSGGQVGGY